MLTLRNNPGSKNFKRVHEIKGASHFIQDLINRENVRVAIATGGLEETAKFKLEAANININGCAFASSSDHHLRTEIMKISEARAFSDVPFESKTYFGDASWDKEASAFLNYNFILVGDRIKHEFKIDDFQNIESILSILNL